MSCKYFLYISVASLFRSLSATLKHIITLLNSTLLVDNRVSYARDSTAWSTHFPLHTASTITPPRSLPRSMTGPARARCLRGVTCCRASCLGAPLSSWPWCSRPGTTSSSATRAAQSSPRSTPSRSETLCGGCSRPGETACATLCCEIKPA